MPHDLVLVGGGHTHVQVMLALARSPEPGLRVTLVTERLATPYSGMLPGHLAGFYRREEMHIDLAGLAQRTGTRLVHARAIGLDLAARRLRIDDGDALPFDTLSLNTGIVPDLSRIKGAAEHGMAVKPISDFLGKFDAMVDATRRPDGPRCFVIVGGGAAGAELACALRVRLSRDTGLSRAELPVTLVTGGQLVESLNAGVRSRLRAALERHTIRVLENWRVAALEADAVISESGTRLPADRVLISTHARAPNWLAASGLPVAADGSVQTQATLQVNEHNGIFAAGDCATMLGAPRPKAGVFAVRQGPVLAANLRAASRGETLQPYEPQAQFLTILSTADGRAIAGRGRNLALEGPLVWRWKDWIDRRFMRRFA
jgi:selenide,water dikinase